MSLRFNKLLIVFIIALSVSNCYSQNLIKTIISDMEKKEGVIKKYEYHASDSYGYIGLLLYKDGNYKYKLESFSQNLYSNGKWKQLEKQIILNSDISKDNLPVKIYYITDTTGNKSGFIISIVEDLRKELLTDAFVYINNDSVQCLPLTGTCLGTFNSINQVKVVFENGYSSKWIKIDKKEFNRLLLVVQVDFNISNYFIFENRKYLVKGDMISLVED